MPLFTTIATIAGLAIAGASAGLAIENKIETNEAGAAAAAQANTEAEKAKKDAADHEAQQTAAREQQQQRKRQVAQQQANYGRASTLLTGPSGLGGSDTELGA